MKLADAQPEIRAAILRLLEKPKEHRPFLIVENKVTGQFVQFAGSDREDLLFDVPALGVSYRMGMKFRDDNPHMDPANVRELAVMGALAAVRTLRNDFRLPDFAEIDLYEAAGTRDPS